MIIQRWPAQMAIFIVWTLALGQMWRSRRAFAWLEDCAAPIMLWMAHLVIFFGFLAWRIVGVWQDKPLSIGVTWWSLFIYAQGGLALLITAWRKRP